MPSVSDRQRRFMAAAAHDPAFAKSAGIKQSVAKEFFDADQRQHPSASGVSTHDMNSDVPHKMTKRGFNH